MAYLHDRVLDNGLSVFAAEGSTLALCSAQPASYAEAAGAFQLGAKSSLSIGAPAARVGGGRQVTVAGFSNGVVSASGTATHWAILDPSNSRLLAAHSLSASQVVTAGNSFTLPAFAIEMPGVV